MEECTLGLASKMLGVYLGLALRWTWVLAAKMEVVYLGLSTKMEVVYLGLSAKMEECTPGS